MNAAENITVRHQDTHFDADHEKLAGTFISGEASNTKGRILFLHGAGNASRQRIFYLADHLATKGYNSFCFDFSGHGQSSGTMQESSLARRTRQAQAALEFIGAPAADILIGSSMGGYIATTLAANPSIHTLILICPALYATDAYNIPFNADFTAILQRPHSFRDAHVLKNLESFSGKVLLLIGAEDQVIPSEVMDIYKNAFKQAFVCQYVIMPDAPHQFHAWGIQKPENSKKIFDVIDSFLDESSQ